MKLLLDSHAFFWATSWPSRLSERARELIEDPRNLVWVSAMCAYELEFKRPRDPEVARLPADLDAAVKAQGFAWLAVDERHAVAAGRLPRLHGDPFDRMIAAQALVEQATIVTRDPQIGPYGAVTAW